MAGTSPGGLKVQGLGPIGSTLEGLGFGHKIFCPESMI